MIPFGPVIEPEHPGAFLMEDPLISLREGRLLDIPWMTGVTSEEGALKVPGRGNMFSNLFWITKANLYDYFKIPIIRRFYKLIKF